LDRSRACGHLPEFGRAASYSIVAGSIVTNAGNTTISGDLAFSPSIGVFPHVTGFLPGIVNAPGAIHDADPGAAAPKRPIPPLSRHSTRVARPPISAQDLALVLH